MIFSAQDIALTRLCAAANCPDDALTGHCLCERCAKRERLGVRVPLHIVPDPVGPVLKCSGCNRWLPDGDFAERTPSDAGYSSERRGRRGECRECDTKRKRRWRQENRDRTNRLQRERRARGGS